MKTRQDELAELATQGITGPAAEAIAALNGPRRHEARVNEVLSRLGVKHDSDGQALLKGLTTCLLDRAGIGGHGGYCGDASERHPALAGIPRKQARSGSAWDAARDEAIASIKATLERLRDAQVERLKSEFNRQFPEPTSLRLTVYPAIDGGKAWLSYRWMAGDAVYYEEASVELLHDERPWAWALAMSALVPMLGRSSVREAGPAYVLAHSGHAAAWAALANWARGESVKDTDPEHWDPGHLISLGI